MVDVKDLNLDAVLAKKGAEWQVKQGERFYQSLGFSALPTSFWEKSSLYPLPKGATYKKNNHASAWHMDLNNDLRSLMSVEANTEWYETAHHELGHIFYYQTYSNPDVPPLLRQGANRAYHEAIGSMMGLAAKQKPFLVGLPACFFNLSHSQGAGLIGISSTAEIGVDVEILRSIPDADALSRDNFSSAEQAALSSAQGPSRDLRFLSGWTRKEACLKAVGSGLSIHPATFEVGLEPETREVAIQSEAGLLGLRVGSFRHGTAILGALAQRL